MTSSEPTLNELLLTWQQWSYRNLLAGALVKAQALGDAEGVQRMQAGLEREPVVAPLAALAANQELSSLLRGWQWHAIRAAREQGASWEQVAEALHTTPHRARADFLDQIERAERYRGLATDTSPYRAVLDEPAAPATEPAPSARPEAAAPSASSTSSTSAASSLAGEGIVGSPAVAGAVRPMAARRGRGR